MRALPALALLSLSLLTTEAFADTYTCTCIATDRTCRITWGRSNSSRNVGGQTVITRMSRQVAKISGGGEMIIFTGPFAAESYGAVLKPGEIPPEQQVRIHGEENLRKWRCVRQAAPPPAPVPPPPAQLDVTTEDPLSRRPLYRAARDGDEVLVRQMIAAGAVVRDKDTSGDTAMHVAVRNNHVAAVKFLIEAGADPNEVTGTMDGRTPLQYAVDKRKADMVGQLLSQGARPNDASMTSAASSGMMELIEPQLAKGGNGQVVLQVLIEKKNTSMLGAMLTKVRPNKDVTLAAARSGDVKTVELVMGAGGNPTVVLDHAMDNKDASMATLALAKGAKPGDWLATAVVMEDQALVNAMLDRGASAQGGMIAAVNTGQVGMARLLLDSRASAAPAGLIAIAAKRADSPMAVLLLDAGAKPDNGMDAAVDEGHAGMVRLLLDRGASGTNGAHMRSASSAGRIAIVDLLLGAGGAPGPGMVPACGNGRSKVLVKLIGAGGDATTKDCIVDGVKGGHEQVVTVLLQNEARTDWRVGRKEETLLQIAANGRHYGISQSLLETGVPIDDVDKDGETALHHAARANDNVAVMDLLIKNGADLNATNEKGKTVLKVAKGRKNNKHLKAIGGVK